MTENLSEPTEGTTPNYPTQSVQSLPFMPRKLLLISPMPLRLCNKCT